MEKLKRKREPIRCFEGTAKPHEAFWKWRDVDTDSTLTPSPSPEGGGETEPEMELYGYISEYSWFDDDITPKMFKDDLYRIGKGRPITVRINSGGGDVIAASVMRAILMDYPGRLTVKIDGLAASAATLVAIAGDVVKMQESAYFMIHDPMVALFLAVLNIEDLSRLLDGMKTAKKGLVDAYETKSKLNRDKISRMMVEETWMTAREAVDYGFVDEVISQKAQKKGAGAAPLQNAAIVNALHNFVNIPEALRALLQPEVNPDDSVMGGATPPLPNQPTPAGLPAKAGSNKAAEKLRAESKLYKEKKI